MAETQLIDLDQYVSSVNVRIGTSKTGSKYSVLVITLDNGLDIEMLLDRPYAAVIDMLLKQNTK